MKFEKKAFLRSNFGKQMTECARRWDEALELPESPEKIRNVAWCLAQWEVYREAVKHFCGVEYHFTRTDDYYGICTEDEEDFLLKVNRRDREPELLMGSRTTYSRQKVRRWGIEIDGVKYWNDDLGERQGETVIVQASGTSPDYLEVKSEDGELIWRFARKEDVAAALRRTRELKRIAGNYRQPDPEQSGNAFELVFRQADESKLERHYEDLIEGRIKAQSADEKIIQRLTRKEPAKALAYVGLQHPAAGVIFQYLAAQKYEETSPDAAMIKARIATHCHGRIHIPQSFPTCSVPQPGNAF